MKKVAEVIVIQPGYAIWQEKQNAQRADGTISFIRSTSHNIIVDTGLPKDKDIILNFLKKSKVSVQLIDTVICTHGDADHISNNNLFPNAKLIVGFDIYINDTATFFENEYVIDRDIKVIKLVGHDSRSVGIEVNEKRGKIFIVGDLFEYENDWERSENWIAFSKNPFEHLINRAKIWQKADFIVPGHGDLFKVNKQIDIFSIEIDRFKKHFVTKNVYGDQDSI